MLPNELLALLELAPGYVILGSEGRPLGYANVDPHNPFEKTCEGAYVVFDEGPDIETNMRSALNASKALIAAGYNVDVRANAAMNYGGRIIVKSWAGLGVTVDAWRDVEVPHLDVEINALVETWGGRVDQTREPIKGPEEPEAQPHGGRF